MKIREDFRVVTYVDDFAIWNNDREKREREMVRRGERLRDEIMRHCDGFTGKPEVQWTDKCGFCGSAWENPPQCCDKAIAENDVTPLNHAQQR